ncbi:MAG: tetratricopeptide repeat protein [Tepidisphaeraceae bacterium]
MPTFTPIRRTVLLALALITLTVAVYWPVTSAQYLSIDDHAYVTDNQTVQAGLTRNGVVWAFSGVRVSNYHPLTWLSHMLDNQLFGSGSRPAHLVNLALHAINSVLLLLVLRWMTGREWCSAFVAAIFALHPQHVESVAWVSERKDVLSGLFWMLTLAAWAWHVESPRWWKYAITLVAFALGLLSKPMVVTLPCVLLLLDFWPLRRMKFLAGDPAGAGGYRKSLKFLVAEKIPFFLLAAAGSIATVLAQSRGGAVVTMEQVPLSLRVGNSIVAYARYLRKFLWPSDLAAFYPLDTNGWPVIAIVAAVVVLLAVTAVVLIKGRSKPYLPVGWLWFVGTLVPVIGLLQVGSQAMADRYMYLPMIGLAVMVTWGVADLLTRERMRRFAGVGAGTWATAAACVALLGCVIVTSMDVRAWKDSETLFTRALERTKPNIFTLHNIAAARLVSGNVHGAVQSFEQCLAIQPYNPHVLRAYGCTLREAKRYADAERSLKRSIKVAPNDSRTWGELGHVYFETEKWTKAVQRYSKAIELRPDDFDVYLSLTLAQRMAGDAESAVKSIEQALKINPRLSRAWYIYGALLVECKRPAEAIEPLQRAAALEPTMALAHHQLGIALMRSGRGGEALTPLMTSLNLDPKSPAIMTELAWVLATHPDAQFRRGEEAVYFAQAAADMTGSSWPEALDALAAAQAEQKQFAAAAATAEKAAKLAREAKNEILAVKIEQRATRYRANEATRDATLAGTDAGAALP